MTLPFWWLMMNGICWINIVASTFLFLCGFSFVCSCRKLVFVVTGSFFFFRLLLYFRRNIFKSRPCLCTKVEQELFRYWIGKCSKLNQAFDCMHTNLILNYKKFLKCNYSNKIWKLCNLFWKLCIWLLK